MKKFLQCVLVCLAMMTSSLSLQAQQVPHSDFEDWSATAFNGEPQAAGWNASNVEQFGFKFNFAHKEAGRNGGSCMMVQDQDVGAVGITETSPGYCALGQPWAYVPSLTAVNQATAGTSGGISWTYRPDTMSVWIRRTGDNWSKEDFYLLYYSWVGTAKGNKYKAKNGNCTSHEEINEESDVRQALNGNECGTTQKVTQVAEGMWRERKEYGNWTNIRVPIFYMNNEVPTMMNIIFSASNYPNFRANSGLYAGNSLYVDDLEMIYSSSIQELWIGGKKWNGFDPASTEVQSYSLGENATAIPSIEAVRGAGKITNAHGTTVQFTGRVLSGSEISINKGDLESKPTTIVVKSGDGKSTTTYKIQFQRAASANAKLAGISVNDEPISGFSPSKYNYNVELPYGTTAAPKVTYTYAEDGQTAVVTQATSPTGKATIVVTAPNKTNKETYTLQFSVGKLKDNTLYDILVNGKSIPGFTPTQTVYKVSLPTNTTSMPTVKAVSAYPDGEQTIVYTAPATYDGGVYQISVSSPGNPTPKVYKLNLRVEESSYSYLANLQVLGDQIADVNPSLTDEPTVLAFSPDYTTYYVNLKMGTTTLPQILYTPGDEFQTITKEEGGIDGTTRITVTAGNHSDQTVYKLIFSTAKSEISTLLGIEVGGKPIEGFQPDKTTYDYVLPVNTTVLPEIKPIAHDEFQTITVTTGGVNGRTRISVTAGNGNTTNYYINFSVATYTDNHLKSLTVKGYNIGFDPDKNDYTVDLPQGTTSLPAVTYELKDPQYQTAEVRPLAAGVLNGDYKIIVRPVNGASRTYVIHFSVAVSNNNKLKMLYVDGDSLEGFQPEVNDYIYALPQGVNKIPEVTYEKGDETQLVSSVLDKRVQRITVTAQSGAQRQYTITFKATASTNSKLNMIYVDGDSLTGFNPDVLAYTYTLKGDVCPPIRVDQAPGQQVTITAPYAAGTASIYVKPGEGEINIYTIDFIKTTSVSTRLKDILVDGISLENFDPLTTSYTYVLPEGVTTIPQITYVKDYEEQQVNVLLKNTDESTVAHIYVLDTEGNKGVYDILFTRTMSANKALADILLDGVHMANFDPAVLNYTDSLDAGSTYPQITYITANAAQVVFFGQLAEGKWGITVQAEDGTSATYTLQFYIRPYSDATLANLEVDGYTIPFDPNTFDYALSIDEGQALPELTVTPREGQKIMQTNASDVLQQVMVYAENGAMRTYSVAYTRVMSDNALLSQLYVDGKELLEFRPDSFTYSISLPVGTKVVPNVYPVGQLDNQTITTTFGKPNAPTTIHVLAQDGVTSATYTINFPVEVSTNTKLKSLSIDGFPKDVNETEFLFEMPYGATQPYSVEFEKAEDSQLVEYISAPIDGVTKIIVTAENGDKRTYSIRYVMPQPEGENSIKRIEYRYVNAQGNTVEGAIETPKKGDNIVELPYGAKSFEVTHYEKNYDDQSVYFFNGDIRRGAKIIAIANRTGEADVEYTVTPHMPEFETTGKLSSLTFKGEPVPNFRPDVYNYIVKVTSQPTKGNFVGKAYGNKTVTKSELDNTKKQITLTVADGETYSVCWYYENDDPQFDFSKQWVKAAQGAGYKPTSAWHVPADYANECKYDIDLIVHVNLIYNTGKEVIKAGVNGALLSTLRGAPMNGSVPGMMTTGNMSLSLANNGGSTSSMSINKSTGVSFRNTPERFSLDYSPMTTTNISKWYYDILLTDGTNEDTTHFEGNYNQLNPVTPLKATRTLNYSKLTKPVKKMSFAINSCHTANANDLGTGATGQSMYESQLLVENLHFIYNSELTDIKVNGKPTERDGNVFTYNVQGGDDILSRPILTFTQAVHDQTQTVEWLHDGEWINGELTARVINYGENLQDSTHYYVVLKRTADTDLEYTLSYPSFPQTVKEDTTFVLLPFGTKKMPEVTIQPNNMNQLFEVSKSGNTLTVIVTNELQQSDTAVYVFRENRNNVATLESIMATDKAGNTLALSPAFAMDEENYTVEASLMPELSFSKMGENDDKPQAQTVDLVYTSTGATLLVTAEDGVTTKTYKVTLKTPVVPTSGQISEFIQNDMPWDNLGLDQYDADGAKPQTPVLFTRKDMTDDVVFIQAPTYMAWQVTGSQSHTYTLTYPTSQSTNAFLGDLLLDGVSYPDFVPSTLEYDLEGENRKVLVAVRAEEVQQVATSVEAVEGGINYSIVVTAENGETKTYTLKLREPKSTLATLQAIFINEEELANFEPNTTDYTIVLPAPQGPKTEKQKMPSIRYIAGDEAQTITIVPGQVDGDETKIVVTNETGTDSKEYLLSIKAEPSHCSDLTGIIVNGEAIDQFESGRHYYSVASKTKEVEFDYTSDDRFLTVTQPIQKESINPNHDRYTLHVVAEDGSSTDYMVDVFTEALSGDAQLANILLDDQDFRHFKYADINPNLTIFEPGLNEYHILIPYDSVKPMVSAVLKMDGQTVQTQMLDSVVFLHVTAEDGTPNTYKLYFEDKLSANANLKKIEINSVAIPDFVPTTHFYMYELAMGQKWPEIKAEAEDNMCDTVMVVSDSIAKVATITVIAQDTIYSSQYTISVNFKPSDADTLDVILENERDTLPGFDPHRYYYTRELPVGSVFPTLSYGDRYPNDGKWPYIADSTVLMDTINQMWVHQTTVTAQSGKKNVYTVSYSILKSDVDTLQMIFVDEKQMPGFNALQMEYYYTLTSDRAIELDGRMPEIDMIHGDDYQNVVVSQAPDSLSVKSLAFKHLITVTAANGKMRTYTIHYPVELSSDATLNMIMLENKPLTNFDSERMNYKIELGVGATIPVVSVVKKEEAQTYEIYVDADTVRIDVWAEDGTTSRYTLVFDYVKSDNAKLTNIILTDEAGKQLPYDLFYFHTDTFEYTIVMPYDSTKVEFNVPDMNIIKADTAQTVEITENRLSKAAIDVIVRVVAPNGLDETEYRLNFRFTRNNDALLAEIRLADKPLEGFLASQNDYTVLHPFGSDSTAFYSSADVTVTTHDALATYTIEQKEGGMIEVRVVAQDETTENTYRISQQVSKDPCATLKNIWLDSVALDGFKPEVTFYTYELRSGAPVPTVEAEATSANATVEDIRVVQPGDTCRITCVAADMSTVTYAIYFKVSTIDEALAPTANDVLIRRVPGSSQIFVASIRKDVTFILYDNAGHMLSYTRLENANPNDVSVGTDGQNRDVLLDVTNLRSGTLFNVNIGQVYFYSFVEGGSKIIKYGKLIMTP